MICFRKKYLVSLDSELCRVSFGRNRQTSLKQIACYPTRSEKTVNAQGRYVSNIRWIIVEKAHSREWNVGFLLECLEVRLLGALVNFCEPFRDDIAHADARRDDKFTKALSCPSGLVRSRGNGGEYGLAVLHSGVEFREASSYVCEQGDASTGPV